jgi:hypothetical protein
MGPRHEGGCATGSRAQCGRPVSDTRSDSRSTRSARTAADSLSAGQDSSPCGPRPPGHTAGARSAQGGSRAGHAPRYRRPRWFVGAGREVDDVAVFLLGVGAACCPGLGFVLRPRVAHRVPLADFPSFRSFRSFRSSRCLPPDLLGTPLSGGRRGQRHRQRPARPIAAASSSSAVIPPCRPPAPAAPLARPPRAGLPARSSGPGAGRPGIYRPGAGGRPRAGPPAVREGRPTRSAGACARFCSVSPATGRSVSEREDPDDAGRQKSR